MAAKAGEAASPAAGREHRVRLEREVMETLGPARVFDVPAAVRSLTFSDSGERLLIATEDGGIHMYDCLAGAHLGSSSLAEHGGTDLIRFTHGRNKVLFSSPGQSRVGYFDLAAGALVHAYEGHTGRVTALEMSPCKDVFASGDANSVKIWELVHMRCIGNLTVKGTPVLAWDPSGLAIGVACSETGTVALYDPNNLGKPFLTLHLHPDITRVTSMSFSSNGELILVGAEGGTHYIYDGFDTASRLLFVLRGHDLKVLPPAAEAAEPEPGQPDAPRVPAQDLCWTPDGRFVLTGGTQSGAGGQVCIWEIPESGPAAAAASAAPEELDCVVRLSGPPVDPSVVAFNPTRALLVTAGQQVCFWLPSAEAAGVQQAPGAGESALTSTRTDAGAARAA